MANTKNPVAQLNHIHLIKILELLELKNDTELCQALKCSPALISRLRHGQRAFSPMMCARVRLLTNGKMTGYQLRPDIYN
jgi:DNA-binding transcriptional regulator YdaS (Cro superfamily)